MESDTSNNKNASNIVKEVSVLDAVHMLADAWKLVKPSTIANCFKKAFKREANVHVEVLADVPTPENMDREEFEALIEQDVDDVKAEEDVEEENMVEAGQETEHETEQKISYKECLESVAKVRNYCQEREGRVESIVYDSLTYVQNMCLVEAREKKKQRRITDFFKKN